MNVYRIATLALLLHNVIYSMHDSPIIVDNRQPRLIETSMYEKIHNEVELFDIRLSQISDAACAQWTAESKSILAAYALSEFITPMPHATGYNPITASHVAAAYVAFPFARLLAEYNIGSIPPDRARIAYDIATTRLNAFITELNHLPNKSYTLAHLGYLSMELKRIDTKRYHDDAPLIRKAINKCIKNVDHHINGLLPDKHAQERIRIQNEL